MGAARCSPLQARVTYQISHKCQVCYGEERCQHIKPHTVECGHIHHDEVHVNGTHDQDHQTSSYFKYPAKERKNMFKVKKKNSIFYNLLLYLMMKMNLQSIGKLIHERWQTGESEDGNEGKWQL